MVEESHHDFETFYQNGLELILDYNEERQYYNINDQTEIQAISTLYPNNNDVTIHLDTISRYNLDK